MSWFLYSCGLHLQDLKNGLRRSFRYWLIIDFEKVVKTHMIVGCSIVHMFRFRCVCKAWKYNDSSHQKSSMRIAWVWWNKGILSLPDMLLDIIKMGQDRLSRLILVDLFDNGYGNSRGVQGPSRPELRQIRAWPDFSNTCSHLAQA